MIDVGAEFLSSRRRGIDTLMCYLMNRLRGGVISVHHTPKTGWQKWINYWAVIITRLTRCR
jgi:hypothetical protein